VRIRVGIESPSPIERVDLRCGARTLETIRPYDSEALGRRVRVVWEGAEYRGRGRMTTWDGTLRVTGNELESFTPINFWHLDKKLERRGTDTLAWESVTTGNFAGADMLLRDAASGRIDIDTPHAKASIAVAEIGLDDTVIEAGGLARRVRAFRLPDQNPERAMRIEREVEVLAAGDSPIYVRVTLENGHQAWSSPIYLFRQP
jgi:hypothetical protein